MRNLSDPVTVRFDDAGRAFSLATEGSVVGIEQDAVVSALWRADAVVRELHLCEIADSDDLVSTVVHAAEGNDGICAIVA